MKPYFSWLKGVSDKWANTATWVSYVCRWFCTPPPHYLILMPPGSSLLFDGTLVPPTPFVHSSLIKYFSFYFSFLVWPLLPIHFKCRGLMLHPITLNHTHIYACTRTCMVELLWKRDRHVLPIPLLVIFIHFDVDCKETEVNEFNFNNKHRRRGSDATDSDFICRWSWVGEMALVTQQREPCGL